MIFPYIEDNFISLSECQRLIDFADANKSSNVSRDDVYSTNIEWVDHGATYYGNNVDPITPEDNDEVVTKVTEKCKSLVDCQLGYVGIVRWPVGTFKNPHYDDSSRDDIFDIFAAMIYLNDDFNGGHTGFENFEVVPKTGQLCIFSNSQYKHHVTKVEDAERFVLSFWYNNDCKPRLVKTLKNQSINYDGATLTFI